MKKLIILSICFLSVFDIVKAQYVDIPDSIFRKILIGKYPACFNGANQMDTACSSIVKEDTLDLSYYIRNPNYYNYYISENLKDLTGLQYFKKLTYFDCSNLFNLPYLPALPKSLKHLNCGNDSLLTTLPSLPDSLQYLDCSNYNYFRWRNKLASLPTLPNSLQLLDVTNCSIKILPILPNSLQTLICNFDSLTVLPALPESLQILECSDNYLSSIPTLPKNLEGFACRNNLLQTLPPLPESLQSLECGSNNITSLPPMLPKKLQSLDVTFTPISMLPSLDSLNLNRLLCGGDSNLLCLPRLPVSIICLRYRGSGIHCFPNFLPLDRGGIYSDDPLPLCAPVNNVNQCKAFPTVTGKVFGDENSNGIKDVNENYLPYVPVRLNTGGVVNTDNNGQYITATHDTGSFTVSVTPPPHFKVVPDSLNINFATYNGNITLSDIALQPTNLFDSLGIYVDHWRNAVPGRAVYYYANYVNIGTTTTTAKLNFTYDTSKLIFDSSSVPLVSHVGNTLTWKDTLTPNYYGGNYYYYGNKYPSFAFTVKKTVQLGDSIICSASVVSPKTSATTSNTTIARSSYDPNSKEATPQLTTKQVISGQMIDYVIHFQNVGNAPADNVVIADTISPLLTNGIMQLIGSSHNVKTSMDSNIIYFDFHNINLIDSTTDQLKSNGFVHFRLKPRTSISEGTNIDNKASVYFDYNSPVVTNTATTLIKDYTLPVSIRSFSLQEILGSNSQVASNWTCANELNIASYNVQRSVDASNFNTIGSVKAKGNGSYSFLDLNAGNYAKYKTVYYRLQMVDKDGSIRYSKTISVQFTVNSNQLTVFPNPSKDVVTVSGKHITSVQVVDNLGRVIKLVSLKDATNPTISVSSLPVGVYHLRIQTTDGKVSGVGFMKE